MPRLPQLPRLPRQFRHPRLSRLLSHPRLRHPLVPALGAALLCQAALISLLRPSQSSASPPPPTGDQAQATDDTPELLRLSRTLLQSAATPNPQLSQLLALPLPPPPELTQQQPAAPPRPPAPSAVCPAGPKQAAKAPGPAPAAASGAAKPPTPPPAASVPAAPGELPSQPGQALELAKAIAGGRQALTPEGASPSQVALQRRQWWLTAQEAGQLQRAWDQAEAEAAPDDWAPLPAGAQLRRVERQSLGPLGGGDPRGRSLVNREQITLLWGSGPQLWLLRLPLAG